VELTGNLAKYTWLLFLATAGLVLGTISLAGVGFWQVLDNKRAIAAAQTSADAALLQARAAVNAERPYVRLSDIKLVPVSSDAKGDVYQLVFEFVNWGKTPAFNLIIGTRHVVAPHLPPEPEYSVREAHDSILEPHGGMPCRPKTKKPSAPGMLFRSSGAKSRTTILWEASLKLDFAQGSILASLVTDGSLLREPGLFSPVDSAIPQYRYQRYTPQADASN
jgi:hypothetical protein